MVYVGYILLVLDTYLPDVHTSRSHKNGPAHLTAPRRHRSHDNVGLFTYNMYSVSCIQRESIVSSLAFLERIVNM